MAMFTLAMSCLTTSNLPWFMDLTFQVPMQYCSLQHQTWLSPPDTSTTGHHFHFGSASSFFLELKEHSLNILSWAISLLFPNSILDTYLTWEAHLSLSYLFCFFILFMGFSRQEYWSGLPFSSPVDYVLSGPDNHHSTSCLYEFDYSRCLIWVESNFCVLYVLLCILGDSLILLSLISLGSSILCQEYPF